MRELPVRTILVGDARRRINELPAASVDCILTSPPYFRLRDYGATEQIGLEETVDEWVDQLRIVFRGIARVLKRSGCAWINVGDSYSRNATGGAPAKSLLLGPERLALALLEDGWTVRNRVAWTKSNTMPNSVADRLSAKWEFVYLLTRSERYFFDLDAIRVPHRSQPARRARGGQIPAGPPKWAGPLAGSNSGLARLKATGRVGHPLGKNPGDSWMTATSGFRGQHFATFPPALITRPLLATCPERVCTRCSRPWQRQPADEKAGQTALGSLKPACGCGTGWRSGIVLDPFAGSGTVGLVAEAHGRDWLGIEVNPEFADLAMTRINEARLDRGTT